MAINKVVFGNEVQMDLTEDTVTEDKVLEGETFHDRSGNRRTGNLVIPVQDVEVNGESVVDENGIAEIISYEEVTQAEYDNLPSSKESDNMLYMVYSDSQILDPNYSYHKYGNNDEIIVRVYHEGQSDQQTLWFFRGWNQSSGIMDIPSSLIAYAPSDTSRSIASISFTDSTGATQNGWIGFYSNNIRVWSQDWGLYVTGIMYGVVDAEGAGYPNPQTNPYIDDPYIYVPDHSLRSARRIYLNGREYAEFNIPTTDIQTAVDEFETYNGGILDSLKVALEPVQDLHGYPNPWVGGAGKNKLKVTASSATTSGITFTVNSDGTITANGTATADVYINATPSPQVLNIEPDTDYIVSGCPQGGSANTYYLLPRYYGSEYGTGVSARWSQAQITSGIFVNLYVKSGYTANNLVFKPMIRLATESDPTFEPYSNICPISGHTQVDVDDVGKNILDAVNHLRVTPSHNIIGSANDDGSITITGTTDGTWAYITDVVNKSWKAGTYTFSISTALSHNIYLELTYEDNTTQNFMITSGNKTATITTSKTLKSYVLVISSLTNGTSYNETYFLQVELGSTATAYVPYNGYQVTVNLGGTYYSGTLDVVSGVFTPDTASVVFDGSDDEAWIKASDTRFAITKPADVSANPDGSISNEFEYGGTSGISILDGQFSIGGLNISARHDAITTLADWKTFLSNNPMTIVYPLATPQSIQLSPTMVKALVGENHLDAPLDGQEITESKYRELFTWDEVEAIAQSIADSKIDNHNTSYDTTFSSAFTEARYVKKIYEAPALTALYVVLSGATSVTFNHQLIFSDAQTCCELIQFGSGARIGITDVAISQGSVTFTFDSALTKAIGFRCRITNDFVS